MKESHEHKNNIIQRIINSALESQHGKEKVRAKSPVSKFKYELPKSFFEAVDDARLDAGYDALPRLHHLSVSSSSSSPSHEISSSSSSHQSKHHGHHHHQTRHRAAHSSSTSNSDKVAPKRVRSHQKNHKHAHRHHKEVAQTPSLGSLLQMMMFNASNRSLNTKKKSSSRRSSND